MGTVRDGMAIDEADGVDRERLRQALEKENPGGAYAALEPVARRTIYGIGVVFALFQLWTATFTPLSSLVVRSVHLGFLLCLCFLLIRVTSGSRKDRIPVYDWVLAGLGFAIGLYHLVFEQDLILRAGDPTTLDIAVGVVNIALVVEAARRIMGWGLPLFCVLFLPYAWFGPELPGILAHRGYGFDQIVDQLQFSTEGSTARRSTSPPPSSSCSSCSAPSWSGPG